VKLAALHEFMVKKQVDLAALTECNSAWDHVNHSLRPPKQTQFWWENAHWVLANICQDSHTAAYQPRGTRLVVVIQLSYFAQYLGNACVRLG